MHTPYLQDKHSVLVLELASDSGLYHFKIRQDLRVVQGHKQENPIIVLSMSKSSKNSRDGVIMIDTVVMQ